MTAAEIEASGWRLPDDACALLARLVAEHKPDLIVECGSGRSTVVLAEAVAGYGGRVVTLEHDMEYAAVTQDLLDARALFNDVQVRIAPLVDGWYARRWWEDLHGIGLLFVDGPPGGSSRHARLPAVPLLRDRMLPGCVVILDDVDRDPERQAWAEWGVEDAVFVRHEKATLAYGRMPA